MVTDQTLYQNITAIAEDYFGPVAPRFINRLIESHLHKDPHAITKQDIPELLTWVSVTVSLMTDEQAIVTEFTQRLKTL